MLMTQLYVWVSSYVATLKQEEGQGMAEYALILALVAVLLIGAFGLLRGGIEDVFDNVVNAFSTTE